jgi:hypothetical protein
MVSVRLTEIAIDASNPHSLAQFWCDVLGWVVTDADDDEVEVRPAGSDSKSSIIPSLMFVRVPEAKSVKNRVHLDVNSYDTDQATELERLLGLGATYVDVGQGDVRWHVLADPEGNEFCLLRSVVDPGT